MITLIASAITFILTSVMAMAGVGAAFILVPIFIALGIEIHTAMAVALLLNAISTSVSSATFIRKKLIEWPLAMPILFVAVALSPLGVYASQLLDKHLLLWLFTAFLFFASAMMLFYSPQKAIPSISRKKQLMSGSLIGGIAGFIGGLLGVGGGSIIVPALVGSGLDPKRASATASVVIVFASLTGFMAHATVIGISTNLLVATSIASASGAALGAWVMSEKLKSGHLKFIIGSVLLLTAIKMTWGQLS